MGTVDPQVTRDPVFQQLMQRHELAGRKLRDAVVALRSFNLADQKSPEHHSSAERWRAAHLQELVVQRLEDVRIAAEDLLKYGFELAPHNSTAEHLAEIDKLKEAHRQRLGHGGWGSGTPRPRGIEEQVHVDGGPPITIVIQPKHYEFTERAKRSRAQKNPE